MGTLLRVLGVALKALFQALVGGLLEQYRANRERERRDQWIIDQAKDQVDDAQTRNEEERRHVDEVTDGLSDDDIDDRLREPEKRDLRRPGERGDDT